MNYNKQNVEELVKKAQEGHAESFGKLYDIFLPQIYKFIFYKVLHKELAEDLCEDSFFKAWKNILTYKKTQHQFSSWLYRIASNTVIDYMRKENITVELLADEIPDEKIDTIKCVDNFFNKQRIEKALTKLPETQKEVIILKYVNDLSNNEISEILGKSNTAIRILISRALKKLKEVLLIMDAEKNES